MDIFNKPINSFSFNDVSSFCKQGHIEGIQLDYKKDLSPKGLSKHFAAFSNTRGGIIIIGVEEDKKNGKPNVWNGIKSSGKQVDKIHQYASSVEPIPSYEVHTTNEKNGNVFILIRIFEGDRTPYYVQNDANLWVRTGNIRNPIDIASPDYVEILFGKRNKAKIARKNNIKRASKIYKAAVNRADKERMAQYHQKSKEISDDQQQNTIPKGLLAPIGTDTNMLTLFAQPYYPNKVLINPIDLIDSLDKIRVMGGLNRNEFPSSNMEPIPDGLLKFYWSVYDGLTNCEQIYSNGFVYYSFDVLRSDNQNVPSIYLSHIFSLIIIFFKFINNYYKQVNYQGSVIGNITLKNAAGTKIHRIQPRGWRIWEHKNSLLSIYEWDIDLDTRVLNDDVTLQKYFIEKINEIYWCFGYKSEKEELFKAFLKENGWLVE